MDNKQQPDNIKKILDEKYSAKKISDEFGWIGEYSLSVKDILDIIIDLPTHAEIAQVPDKVPSAEEYWLGKLNFNQVHLTAKQWCALMESYALLREQRAVEQAKEEWRKQNHDILTISMNAVTNNYFYADAVMMSNTIEEARKKIKNNIKF